MPSFNTTVPPLFKWAGSKQRLLAQYEPYFFPAEVTRFVDLFAGGLTTTLWVAEHFPDAELVINDANSELMFLYRTLAADTDGVVAAWKRLVEMWLPLTPQDRKVLYFQWRDAYALNFEQLPDVEVAAMLLIMLQTNFNGLWKAYLKCNRRYSTAPGVCKQRRGFFNERNVRDVAALLARPTTRLLSGDFEQVEVRDSDFIYADPPYRDSIVEYQGGFGEDDHVRLAAMLESHPGSFAYSNKDIGDGFMQQHFPTSRIYPIDAVYTAGQGVATHRVKEVLITDGRRPAAVPQPTELALFDIGDGIAS